MKLESTPRTIFAGASLVATQMLVGCGSAPSQGSEPEVIATSATAIAAANTQADKKLNLVGRVILDNGNAFEFYEPKPGLLLTSEILLSGRPVRDSTPKYDSLSPTELYEKLAHAPAPAALVGAQQRMAKELDGQPPTITSRSDAPTSGGGGQAPSAIDDGIDTAGAALNSAACGSYCDHACFVERGGCTGGNHYSWCFEAAYQNAWADNGGGSWGGHASVCPRQGTATLSVSSDYYAGNFVAPPQTGRTLKAWGIHSTYVTPPGLFHVWEHEHIRFDVTGSNIVESFGGGFVAPSNCYQLAGVSDCDSPPP